VLNAARLRHPFAIVGQWREDFQYLDLAKKLRKLQVPERPNKPPNPR
jgi:hypothetical protein